MSIGSKSFRENWDYNTGAPVILCLIQFYMLKGLHVAIVIIKIVWGIPINNYKFFKIKDFLK